MTGNVAHVEVAQSLGPAAIRTPFVAFGAIFMRTLSLCMLIVCVSACTSTSVQKHGIIENGGKARAFLESVGQPDSAFIQSQHSRVVAALDLETATWSVLPNRQSPTFRYSLIQDRAAGRFYSARESGSSDQSNVLRHLEIFGPIAPGDGTWQ